MAYLYQMKGPSNRTRIEALPAVAALRQTQEILRVLTDRVAWVREDARIVLARASWHLDNRVTAIYAEEGRKTQ
jgi:hypothetical protein